MKLYCFPPSPRSFKVLLVAEHLGLACEPIVLDLFKGEHMTPELAVLNPHRRLPVLDDDGYVLWESNAILEYFASKKSQAGLLPDDIKPRAQIVRWLYWESAHWDPACAIFLFERFVKRLLGNGEASASEIERATKLFTRCADVLETELGAHRFITGDELSLADLCIGSLMVAAELGQYPLGPYPAIRRWHAELTALPSWKKALAAQEQVIPAA
jgi:glutathione S-transferase